MFSFLYSQQKKMRQNAENWLEVADRVRHFRRDLLTDAQNQKLAKTTAELRAQLKEKADAGKLKLAIESLERVLKETGGPIYPASALVENIEFFLVAAIVILGLRAYFVQPFKIPTNSMWPSYYGMTTEVFPAGTEPGFLRKAGRLAALGASNYSLTAPADGEIVVPVFRNGQLAFTEKAGRTMLVFPATIREYTFMIGGQPVKVEVPVEWAQSEYGFDYVVEKNFFPGEAAGALNAAVQAAARGRNIERSTYLVRTGAQPIEAQVYWLPIGKKVRQGEKFLTFDILTGDLLFVDRLSYNFIRPPVGSGFVFRTENIRSPEMQDANHAQIRQYYVKRLVGVPGDVLEIKAPVLYRNGQPIEGADAFGRNARREGLYPGYTNTGAAVVEGGDQTVLSDGLMPPGGRVTVPAKSFFALGDNSPRSKDSRFWGFVPEKDVVGRPLFIYYPLTSRWGPAR